MTEETTELKRESAPQDSRFGGITIRAWLAIMVIGTVCIIVASQAVRAIYVHDYNWSVDGQFWMLASAILAHYFGDKKPQEKDKS